MGHEQDGCQGLHPAAQSLVRPLTPPLHPHSGSLSSIQHSARGWLLSSILLWFWLTARCLPGE